MNMCLLELALCEKCRSSHFQLEEGVKVSGLEWVTDLGWGRVSTPLHAMAFSKSHNCVTECTLHVKFLLKLI